MGCSRISKKLNSGDITDIVDNVKEALSDGESSEAFKIIRYTRIAYCGGKMGKSSVIPANCVLQICQTCCQSICADMKKTGSVDDNSNFVNSFYAILYYFVRETTINISSIIQLLESFLPIIEMMSSSMSKSDANYVNSVLNLMFNYFKKDTMVYCGETLLMLWELMLKISCLPMVDVSLALNLARSMFSYYESCHSTKELLIFGHELLKRYETFCHKVQLSKSFQSSEMEKIFQSLIVFYSQVLKLCITSRAFSDEDRFRSIFKNCSMIIFRKKFQYVQCWDFVESVVQTLVFPMEKPPTGEWLEFKLQECLQKLEKCSESAGTNTTALNWSVFVLMAAMAVLEKYWVSLKDVSSIFTIQVIVVFKKLADALSKISERSKCSACRSDDGPCPLEQDYVVAVNSPLAVLALASKILPEGHAWDVLKSLAVEGLATLEEYVIKVRMSGCSRSRNLSNLLYNELLTFGVRCYNMKEFLLGITYLKKAGSYMPDNSKQSESFYYLALCYKSAGKTKEAAVAAITPLLINSEMRMKLMSHQARLWNQLQEEVNMTTMELVQSAGAQIQALWNSFSQDNVNQQQLFLWELKCYASYRLPTACGFRPAVKVWQTLSKLKPEAKVLLEGGALFLKTMAPFADVGDCKSLIIQEKDQVTEAVLQEVNAEYRPKALWLLGLQSFYCFLGLSRAHISECQKSVKEGNISTKLPVKVLQPEDVPDPNDTCDVNLPYNHLLLIREAELISYLDQAVKFWEKALAAGLALKDFMEEGELECSSENLLRVAFIYVLHHHNKGAAHAWNLCLKFGEKMQLDNLMLAAFSGLVNLVESKPTWINRAEELVQKLEVEPKHRATCLMFYNSRAFHALRTRNYEEGVEMLQKGKDCDNHTWTAVQWKLLLASFSMLPESVVDMRELGHPKVELTVYSAVKMAVREIGRIGSKSDVYSSSASCALIDTLLSTAFWLGRLYLNSCRPREARCFLKAELLLAQQVGLVTRVVEFMVALAEVDILVENFYDAGIKVNDIKTILAQDDEYVESVERKEQDICGSKDKYFLSVPQSNVCLPASPSLPSVSMPAFFKHSSKCQCYTCTNAAVLIQWVRLAYIEGQICTLQYKVHEAYKLFHNGGKLASVVCRKISRCLVLDMPLLQNHDLLCARVSLSIYYGDLLSMYLKDEEAMKRNDIALRLLNDMKTVELFLEAEAMDQKFSFIQLLADAQTAEEGLCDPTQTTQMSTQSLENFSSTTQLTPTQAKALPTPTAIRKPLKAITPSNNIKQNQDHLFPTPGVRIPCIFVTSDEKPDPGLKENLPTTPKLFKTPCKIKADAQNYYEKSKAKISLFSFPKDSNEESDKQCPKFFETPCPKANKGSKSTRPGTRQVFIRTDDHDLQVEDAHSAIRVQKVPQKSSVVKKSSSSTRLVSKLEFADKQPDPGCKVNLPTTPKFFKTPRTVRENTEDYYTNPKVEIPVFEFPKDLDQEFGKQCPMFSETPCPKANQGSKSTRTGTRKGRVIIQTDDHGLQVGEPHSATGVPKVPRKSSVVKKSSSSTRLVQKLEFADEQPNPGLVPKLEFVDEQPDPGLKVNLPATSKFLKTPCKVQAIAEDNNKNPKVEIPVTDFPKDSNEESDKQCPKADQGSKSTRTGTRKGRVIIQTDDHGLQVGEPHSATGVQKVPQKSSVVKKSSSSTRLVQKLEFADEQPNPGLVPKLEFVDEQPDPGLKVNLPATSKFLKTPCKVQAIAEDNNKNPKVEIPVTDFPKDSNEESDKQCPKANQGLKATRSVTRKGRAVIQTDDHDLEVEEPHSATGVKNVPRKSSVVKKPMSTTKSVPKWEFVDEQPDPKLNENLDKIMPVKEPSGRRVMRSRKVS